jgi:hypothetical protein
LDEIQFNSIQFNKWIKIQLKKNEIQIDGESMENLLIKYGVGKNKCKKTLIKKKP